MNPALKLLTKIPRGKVVTYKEFARATGTSPRGAASILAHNKEPHIFPCYKVVSADGELRGYSAPGGIPKKQALLEAEGITFTESGRVEKRHFYTFSQ
jgi:O-6-methylguanine DNA methyltransferase